MALSERTSVAVLLGIAQTFAWASTYYLPAILAAPMAQDLGVSTPSVFAAFSLSLIVAALAGPAAGRTIDQLGGRKVLIYTSVLFALGLVLLASATGPISLCVAWAVIGIGVAFGLYEAAFATAVRRYGKEARNVITGITLIAGFATTISWPITTFLHAHYGWRITCLIWASVHLWICLPLYLALPKDAKHSDPASVLPQPEARSQPSPAPHAAARSIGDNTPAVPSQRFDARLVLMAFFFAATGFVSTAMASHFPSLMQACGMGVALSVTLGMLLGPAQVAARILEFGVLRKMHPLLNARLSTALHPIGAGLLLLLGPPGAWAFALLHGAGNGMLTIAKGTLPLAIFGAQGYGQRQGWLIAPSRIAQALAPWLFGLAIAHGQSYAVLLSGGLGLLAFISLWFLSGSRQGTSDAHNTP